MARQSPVGWACGWLVSAVFWSWIEKSSDFPDRFRNEKWNARAHSVGEHLQRFQSPRSYRAHALSSVGKSSLSQLDMWVNQVRAAECGKCCQSQLKMTVLPVVTGFEPPPPPLVRAIIRQRFILQLSFFFIIGSAEALPILCVSDFYE